MRFSWWSVGSFGNSFLYEYSIFLLLTVMLRFNCSDGKICYNINEFQNTMTMLAGFRSGVHESSCFFSNNMFFFFSLRPKFKEKFKSTLKIAFRKSVSKSEVLTSIWRSMNIVLDTNKLFWRVNIGYLYVLDSLKNFITKRDRYYYKTRRLFYCKIWQMFIAKCGRVFITKYDNFITKSDSYYKMRQF